jgi:type I restriction enzyme, S subunit
VTATSKQRKAATCSPPLPVAGEGFLDSLAQTPRSTAWRTCTLGELLEIKHGYAFLGEHFSNGGSHIVLTPGNFYDSGGFKHKEGKEKWYTGPVPNEYVLKEGDLLVAMTEQAEGLLGSGAIVPTSGVYLHNQRLGLVLIRDERNVDKRFIYYLFNSKPVRQKIRGSASGTKIRHTSPSRIAEVAVSVPPIEQQRQIASVLSAYDELIENNQRRIKILETMARNLYREWFVHFRFPGHGNVRRVSSPLGEIPVGWEVRKLGEVLELNYGKALKKDERRDGHIRVYGSSGVVGTHDCMLVRGPGIVVGRKGNVGSVFWSDDDFFVIDTAYFVTSFLPLRYWFYVLPTLNFINSDAAVPGLSRNQAYALDCILPPSALLATFCGLADTYERQVHIHQCQNENLRHTRDLLLPRLLSGHVAING